MTEQEWLSCSDPERMVDYHRMKYARRKLRLLACACVRRMLLAVEEHLSDPVFAALIGVVERYADGAADRDEFIAARRRFRKAAKPLALPSSSVRLAVNVLSCLSDGAMEGLTAAIASARTVLRGTDPPAAQCALIRCVFTHPARPAAFDRSGLTPSIVSLAEAAYETRDLPSGSLCPARLAVLSDALEEAGCADAGLLTHLRSPGPHVRGCWPLDLVLGKE